VSGYATICADPPWPLEWRGGGQRRNGRGEVHPARRPSVKALEYPTMPLGEIHGLDVEALAAENAHLFLWVPEAFLIEGVGATVARAWGFEPIGRTIVWHKGIGLGSFPRSAHETCLIARRGKLSFPRTCEPSVQHWKLVYETKPDTLGRARASRQHSGKPDGFYDLVRSVSPGPYLELFARRRQRLGWDTYGDEALCHVDLQASA